MARLLLFAENVQVSLSSEKSSLVIWQPVRVDVERANFNLIAALHAFQQNEINRNETKRNKSQLQVLNL